MFQTIMFGTYVRFEGCITYYYLDPVCPLFWGLNKEGPFQAKQGSFGF